MMEIVDHATYRAFVDWYKSRINGEWGYVKVPLGVELVHTSGKLIAAVRLNQGWADAELLAVYRHERGLR